MFGKQTNNINACFVLAPCKLSNVHNMDSQRTGLYKDFLLHAGVMTGLELTYRSLSDTG